MASILKVDTIQDQSGNNIINESGDTITIGASGDTITVPTGATMTVPNGGLSGQNYPAFEAYLGSTQTVTDNTITKVSIDTELFDTNGYYDAVTNYRFTPLVAGKYFVYGSIEYDTSGATNSAINSVDSFIYKNGSAYARSINTFDNNPIRMAYIEVSTVVEFNGSTDYVELFGRIDVNTGTPIFEPDTAWKKATKFGAYRIGA